MGGIVDQLIAAADGATVNKAYLPEAIDALITAVTTSANEKQGGAAKEKFDVFMDKLVQQDPIEAIGLAVKAIKLTEEPRWSASALSSPDRKMRESARGFLSQALSDTLYTHGLFDEDKALKNPEVFLKGALVHLRGTDGDNKLVPPLLLISNLIPLVAETNPELVQKAVEVSAPLVKRISGYIKGADKDSVITRFDSFAREYGLIKGGVPQAASATAKCDRT